MQETDWFYHTIAWKNCSRAYKKSVGGLCERCLSKGIVKPAEFVHHKIHLTPANINDPTITLNWGNLEAVCRDCHAELHPEIYRRKGRRYKIDSLGHVITDDEK